VNRWWERGGAGRKEYKLRTEGAEGEKGFSKTVSFACLENLAEGCKMRMDCRCRDGGRNGWKESLPVIVGDSSSKGKSDTPSAAPRTHPFPQQQLD